MIKRISIYVAMIVFACAAYGQAFEINIVLEEDPELSEWTDRDPPKKYDGDDLFTLINGGADLFFEYGFEDVVAYRYSNDFDNSIDVDVYRMTDNKAAYGIYSMYKPVNSADPDMEAEAYFYKDHIGLLKGSYFATLTASDTLKHVIEDLKHLASVFNNKLQGSTEVPGICLSLPEENLQSVKYFKGNIGLSNIYHFDYRDHFNIVEGAAGEYGSYKVIIFSYRDDESALKQYKDVLSKFSDHRRFTSFTSFDDHFEMLDKKDKGVFVAPKDHLVVAVVMDDPDWDYLPYDILSKIE